MKQQRKTTMTIKVLAYKNGSESARAIRDALGIKMLKKQGSKWVGKDGDTVINWGSSAPFDGIGDAVYLNTPEAVARAANKLTTQAELSDDVRSSNYILPYMTNIRTAKEFIEQGETIVCRTKLTGNSGDGIVIAEKVEDLVDAKLYTVYKKKQQEYRVHVFDGEVISIQRKARKHDVADDDVNWQVRNLDGGFIFARTGFDVPRSVTRAAKAAVKALGLDFGAADIGYHDKEGTFVYEVNTACGLSGSNLTDYVEAFCKKLNLPVPVRPVEYVPPTVPKAGEDGVGAVAQKEEQPKAVERKRVLSNQDVINILLKNNRNKVRSIGEVVNITGLDLKKSKNLVEVAERTLQAREAIEVAVARPAPAPEPVVDFVDAQVEAAPVPPKGTKENPFGEYEEGAILRQVRHDLDKADNVVHEMVDEFAGKWVWFNINKPLIVNAKNYNLRIKGNRWSWGEEHLVPANAGKVIELGKDNIEFTAGNFKKVLTPEQQIKLIAAMRKL